MDNIHNIAVTKLELISIFPSANKAAVALGINRSAISQWDDLSPIPEKRQLQLMRHNPEVIAEIVARRKKRSLKQVDNQQGNPNGTESEAVME